MNFQPLVLVLCCLMAALARGAAPARAPIPVDNAAAFIKAVAAAKPGDDIVVKAGTYELKTPVVVKTQATEAAPVLIRAEKVGAVVFKGTRTLSARDARWVTIEGFVFAHTFFPVKTWLDIRDCEHVRVTRCRFAMDDTGATEKDKYMSVGIELSKYIRVDHCEFGPRTTRSTGDYVSTHNGSRYLQIDHNYFKHRANIGQNGGESVMIHGAGVWAHYAIIEDNLFERCNGEGELIGLKSSRNTVRHNTFVDCEGAISIRDGSYNKVYGNTILSLMPPKDPGYKQTGGVRIFGIHNEVVNNYMYRIYYPLEAEWGDADPVPEENGRTEDRETHGHNLAYVASHDNLIAHNTFVDCECLLLLVKKGIEVKEANERIAMAKEGPIKANAELYRAHTFKGFITPPYAPSKWYFLNNVTYQNRHFSVLKTSREAQPPYDEESFFYFGNVHFSTAKGFTFGEKRKFAEAQWRVLDPKLVAKGEALYELNPASPLKNAARRDYPELEKLTLDADTKDRLARCQDVGTCAPVQRLTPKDVGVESP